MKSLLTSSRKLFTYPNSYKALTRFESLHHFQFGTLKKSGSKIFKKVNAQSITINNDQQPNPLHEKSSSQETQINQYEQQALQMINLYITIDEVKSQPEAIKEIILKQDLIKLKNRLIKALEYNTQNTGREFYMTNKQKVDKIIFDLKSYNSQSEMSTKQILSMFYLCKLASDCGYPHKVDGFELRATIKLNNNVQIVQNRQQQTADTLTPSEAIYGYWLTSKIGCNNHEFKWKVYLMMLNLWSSWKKKISETYHPDKSHLHNKEELAVPPISFSQISSLLEAHFLEEIHLSTEYHVIEFMIENLHASQTYFFTKEQYQKDQNLFIKTFCHLINIEQHFINGKFFFMLQEVINKMSSVIESDLVEKLNTIDENKKKILQSNTLRQFIQSVGTYSPVPLINGQSSKSQQVVEKEKISNLSKPKELNQQEMYKYFIFFNEIRQNNVNFKNLSSDHYSKLQFLLCQILSDHFSKMLKDNKEMSIQMLSIYTRTWIKKQELSLEELQQKLDKNDDPKIKAQYINSLFNQLTSQFNQLIESLATHLDRQSNLTDTRKQKKESFLTQKVKVQQKSKIIFLKNFEQNLAKPIMDFINANGKSTIMNSTLISSQKLALIDSFEDFLNYFFGQQQQQKVVSANNKKQELETTRVLTSQNPYYWMLKYARLQSVHVKDNKLFLKQFESILEKISVNVSCKNPRVYSIISVYNLYAYLCKLQEKMMRNQELNIQNTDIKMENFIQKKAYHNFLTYKNYISSLVFQNKFQEKDKIKWKEIPKKYQIDECFDKDIENFKEEKYMHLMKVSVMNKKTATFNIERFFNIVFRANRYFNHQILSQQILLHLFGTQNLVNKNLMEYISNTNQRSRQNVYELVYMMLLSGSKQYETSIPHTLELKSIKMKIQQCFNDKIKGNLVVETLREVLAPRKTSFLQKTPLKYRLKPYSIFQTVSKQEPLQKKQDILQQFLDIFPSGKSHIFGWMELMFYNIQCWGTHRSEIVSDVVLPWLTGKIKNNDILRATIPYFVLSILRLLRSSSLRTNPSNQKQFVEFLQVSLPILYENLDKSKKQHYYAPLIGYLLQIQQISKRSKISPKKLHQILINCKEIIIKTRSSPDQKDGKYFLKLTQILDRVIESIRNDLDERQNDHSPRQKLFSGDRKQSAQKLEKFPKHSLFGNKRINKTQ